MANQTGYQPGNSSAAGVSSPDGGVSHDDLKRQYLTYLDLKNEEIKEQKKARQYYHGVQWTAEQIKVLNRRKQPVITYNKIYPKLNAIVGLLEKQRSDPKAFPRTPKHEQGAEIATAVMRYVCDEQRWSAISPVSGLDGAINGVAGVEIILEQGDKGDVEIGLEAVDPTSFFYDPRSLKPDFSDARYMGVSRWADIDEAIEFAPDKEAEIRASCESGSELTTNPDYENKWFSSEHGEKKVRLVDHWYRKGNRWFWVLYTGSLILLRGSSYLKDEKDRDICKYVMYSANVDQDGDRYGFERGLFGPQDEYNQRRSKGVHISNTRRLIIAKGSTTDIEKLRVEAARPDGVIEYLPNTEVPQFDDAARAQELQSQLEFLVDARQEIENFGFNPALVGSGVQDMSGRAIALQQQAGIAELGPYLLSFKAWKLRVYRAIWNAVQQHWTAERWIRVTDDDQVAQFLAVNQMQIGPTGPVLVNALGSLDVDIIVDEGPDTINIQAEVFDTMKQLLPALAPMLSPPVAQAALQILINNSPLPSRDKAAFRKATEAGQQPSPAQQAAQQLEIAGAKAKVDDTNAAALLKQAQARKALADSQPTPDNSASKDNLDWNKALLSSLTSVEVAKIGAGTDMDSQMLAQDFETALHLSTQAHERDMAAFNARQRQAESATKAAQPA